MSIARQLYQLQEIDLEIADEEGKLEQVAGRLGKDEVVVAAQEKLDAEKKKLEEWQRQQRSLEGEIDDLANKIEASNDQLYSGRINNPKELSGLQHEVELLKAKCDQLETKDLELMEQVESVETSAAALKQELKEITLELQREQEQLRQEKAMLESSLSDLKQQRQALAAETDAQVLALYDKLRKNKGWAVARVEQGICRGCRISLPSSELQQARSGALVQCGSCSRILYLP
jgi:predicted  nucleic acid-binding Zn-ribbon protein